MSNNHQHQQLLEYQRQIAGLRQELDRTNRSIVSLNLALEEADEKYRAFVENANDAIVVLKGGQAVYVNPALERLLGCSTEGVRSGSFWDNVAPEYRDEARDRYQRLLRGEVPPDRFEIQLVTKSGERVHVEVISRAIRYQGSPAALVTFRDVSERRKVEKALRESERTQRGLTKENAVLAEIGRIITSSPDIETVFEFFAEQASLLISFDRISIASVDFDSGNYAVLYAHGNGSSTAEPGAVLPLAGSLIGRASSRRTGLIVSNSDIQYPQAPDSSLVYLNETRWSMAVPLISVDEVIGVLVFERDTTEAYSDEALELAEKIGAQIAGPVSSAQLYQRLAEESEEREALAEISRTLTSSPEIDEVYSRFAEIVASAIPFDRMTIWEFDADEAYVQRAYVVGIDIPSAGTGVQVEKHSVLERYQQLVRNRAPFLVGDESDHVDSDPWAADAVKAGLRSFMAVPLVSGDSVVGILAFRARRAHVYSDRHLSVAERIANQIGGVIAISQLHRTLERAAKERQTVAEIGRIIGSSHDIHEVYQGFAEQVAAIIPFDRLSISFTDKASQLSFVAYATGLVVEDTLEGYNVLSRGRLAEKVMENGTTVLVQGVTEEELRRDLPGLMSAYRAGLRSFMGVPITHEGQIVGVLHIRSKTDEAYSSRDIELAEHVSTQIAGAVANSRLHSQIRRESQEREILVEIGRVISSTLEITEVYQQFAGLAQRLIPSDRISITVLDQAQGTFTTTHVAGANVPERMESDVTPLFGSLTSKVADTGRGVIINAENQQYLEENYPGLMPGFQAGFRSFLAVPMISKGEFIGVLHCWSYEIGVFAQGDLELAERIGLQIAGAVANAQLYAERLRAEEALTVRTRELEALTEMAKIFVTNESFEHKVDSVLTRFADAGLLDRVLLRHPDPKTRGLVVSNRVGHIPEPPPLTIVSLENTQTGKVYTSGELTIINDLETEPSTSPRLIEQGVKSRGYFPVTSGERVLGVIVADSMVPNHFTDERVRLLSAVADGLGVLMANAELQQQVSSELEHGRRRLEIFQQAASRLALEHDLDNAAQGMLDMALVLSDARYAALALWDSDDRLERWVVSGLTPDEQRTMGDYPTGRGLLGFIRDESQTVHIDDIQNDPRFTGFPPNHPSMKSLLGVPISSKNGAVRGAFYLTDKIGSTGFSEDDARIMGLFGVLMNIMLENTSLYNEVLRERRTLSSIQECMSEGLIVTDSQARIVYFNNAAERLLDLSAQDVSGRRAEEVLADLESRVASPDEIQQLHDVMSGTSEFPEGLELTLLHPTRRDLVVTAFPIPIGAADDLTGLILHDATQERELERRRDTFVSVASHELRTPLTGIMGFTELLLGRNVPDSTRTDWLNYIYKDSQRLTSIVDELLNVSRIQSGRLTVELESLDPRALVDEALARIRPMTSDHRVLVVMPSDLPALIADRDRFNQVIINLVSNSAKYSPSGGEITVSAMSDPTGPHVVFSVSDQGMGIAPEDQARLFTTFHRIQRPETEGIGGSGLGLYIVKSLVELMGGEVWVRSKLNEGTTFSFSIPIDESTEPQDTFIGGVSYEQKDTTGG